MKKELWKILPQRAQEAHAIADFLGLPPLAASVLAARGYGPESAKALLSCEDVLCDPLLMKDLDRAAQTVAETVADGGMICIYGDYDCDGVTSTVMLKHYFDAIGARSCYYIPHREREGYGLNIPAIDELHRLGVDLILTVDNGVTAVEEIAHAYSLGMRVVVTDHHRPGRKRKRWLIRTVPTAGIHSKSFPALGWPSSCSALSRGSGERRCSSSMPTCLPSERWGMWCL